MELEFPHFSLNFDFENLENETPNKRVEQKEEEELDKSVEEQKACTEPLGMESGLVTDAQITASSQWDANHAAIQARLNFKAGGDKEGGWSAQTNDVNQWIQVDLTSYTNVTRIATQGRNAFNQWVTKYKLQYSEDGVNFYYYMEPDQNSTKEFDANQDSDTLVYHQLSPPILARSVRLVPTAWNNHISMRMELYGCELACTEPLGMESGLITDAQITASSQWDANHAAIQGRLNFKAGGGKEGGWSAQTNDVNQWIQVDLTSYTNVTWIATQGRNAINQWVTKYKLQYSEDGVNFYYYMEPGQNSSKEFDANQDSDTIVYHQLSPPNLARYVRLVPTAWNNHISLRMELYGCELACTEPLGMESGLVTDAQITASSQWDANHAAIQGRLNFKAGGGKEGGWSAQTNDVNQWIQVDLTSYTNVTWIATQGRNAINQWVTKYKLQYSEDGVNFYYYMEPGQNSTKEFDANEDSDTPVYHDLSPPILARYVRLVPTAWNNHISMRMELYGCEIVSTSTTFTISSNSSSMTPTSSPSTSSVDSSQSAATSVQTSCQPSLSTQALSWSTHFLESSQSTTSSVQTSSLPSSAVLDLTTSTPSVKCSESASSVQSSSSSTPLPVTPSPSNSTTVILTSAFPSSSPSLSSTVVKVLPTLSVQGTASSVQSSSSSTSFPVTSSPSNFITVILASASPSSSPSLSSTVGNVLPTLSVQGTASAGIQPTKQTTSATGTSAKGKTIGGLEIVGAVLASIVGLLIGAFVVYFFALRRRVKWSTGSEIGMEMLAQSGQAAGAKRKGPKAGISHQAFVGDSEPEVKVAQPEVKSEVKENEGDDRNAGSHEYIAL
ncbi:hypothetical protein ACROYT_G026213 [Oculina patagonica]